MKGRKKEEMKEEMAWNIGRKIKKKVQVDTKKKRKWKKKRENQGNEYWDEWGIWSMLKTKPKENYEKETNKKRKTERWS